ncbi:hypothetical protein [Winogradskyella sp.]|uniref:hypothetical protein n=1 Tax=Winogradskyella sp. TaxID=1883156 RepID=UPI003BA9BF87
MNKHPKNRHTSEKVFPYWVWLIYAILFALSIPWYLSEAIAMRLVLGLPLWLVANICAIVMMAGFTIWTIRTYWKD